MVGGVKMSSLSFHDDILFVGEGRPCGGRILGIFSTGSADSRPRLRPRLPRPQGASIEAANHVQNKVQKFNVKCEPWQPQAQCCS